MKIKLIIVAVLALAFTVPTHAQMPQPTPIAAVHATSEQFAAQITASGVTLPSGQTASTITAVQIVPYASLANPIAIELTFTGSGGALSSEAIFPISSAQVAAFIAAGPTLSVASPRRIYVRLDPKVAGQYDEGAL